MRRGQTDNQPWKLLVFQGSALADLRGMPLDARTAFGHELWELQTGITPDNASPFELSHANEVMKLTERFDGDTFRCVYAAKFDEAVYVLHVFQKKSKSGIATPKKDIDLVYSRLERAKLDYAAAFGSEAKVKRGKKA
jgi:phage-related protein